ncbi:YpbF family protein [Alkalihalophilus marmarensis]|uniref:DUF2663 family protein n=1 Tax=Alkalihalophilus marmarensis DSM 21297 TaxID=1188261 RepID=U6STZ2_9BACI|nr:YpbF family protein [Alkalihalophilus marmarensis]ERN54136.1 hypothetical protein A33I_06850 [Alkalihalophilus marmarensis DSM 21297]MCM3488441.1 YpbF family protein [Alkalihalophilus marmarensis]
MTGMKQWNIHPDALTNVSKVMLEEMIARKEKWEKLNKAKNHWSSFTLLSLGLFLLFGAQVLRGSSGLHFSSNFLSILVGNTILLLLILLFIVGIVQVKLLSKKTTKAEIEFEALREECIERSSELWEKDQSWQQRESVFTYMKTEHDINLYHK